MIKAPFPWFGGKSRVADEVWARFGNVDNYIEPFCGSAAVLLARPHRLVPYQMETVNDLDGCLINFYRAVAHDLDGVVEHANWPVMELDLHARNKAIIATREGLTERLRDDPEYYDSRLAGWWVWGINAWIGQGWASVDSHQFPAFGNKGRGTHRHTPTSRPCADTVRGWLSGMSARLRAVRVACGDWSRVLGSSMLTPGNHKGMCGVFLDPPYMDGAQQYAAGGTGTTLSDDVRAWCVEHGSEPNMRIALCGYEGDHDELEALGWSVHAWKAKGGYGVQSDGEGRANASRERVWFSPHCLSPAQQTLF